MAKTVIDDLEPVEVEEEQRKRALRFAADALQASAQLFMKQRAIGEAGQSIEAQLRPSRLGLQFPGPVRHRQLCRCESPQNEQTDPRELRGHVSAKASELVTDEDRGCQQQAYAHRQ